MDEPPSAPRAEADPEDPEYSGTLLPVAAQEVIRTFPTWSSPQRTAYLQTLVNSMSLADQVSLANVLEPHLRRDFFCMLPEELCWKILSCLDDQSLGRAAQVNRSWNLVLSNGFFWKRVINLRQRDSWRWRELCRKREAQLQLKMDNPTMPWRLKFVQLKRDLMLLDKNWQQGNYRESSIPCNGNGIYCLQYDDRKIITGSRDNAIKIWDLETHENLAVLSGHQGSVLCLQFDGEKIISGSSDATVKVWDIHTGECLQTLTEHTMSVLHLRFLGDMLVTCSKDKSVMLWQRMPDTGLYEVMHDLKEHRAAVNVVEFDEQYIVSASGDRTIRIWNTQTAEEVATLKGHNRGIACLQYRGNTIVTGSSDQTVRKWNIAEGTCELKLEGHQELVRCVRFNERYIISGSYDKSVRIWNIETGQLLHTLHGHQNRVFRLQFDMFKIISSSQDDQIRIWDFGPLCDADEEDQMDSGWGDLGGMANVSKV